VNSPIITTAGAYLGIDEADYHRAANLLPGPSLSSTGAKRLLTKSPRHFWFDSPMNPGRPEPEEKPHLNIGKAAHDMVLLGERWGTHYHVLPDGYHSGHTKKWEEAIAAEEEAREAGKVIIRHQDAAVVEAVGKSIQSNPLAVKLLTNGEPEVTIVWQDKETGVWLRCRPDFLPRKRIIIPDLKFMADGSRKGFSRAIGNNGYALSAAMYLDGIQAVHGDQWPAHWMHIVVEKDAPHVVALYELPREDVERGRWLYRRAVRQFAKCLSEDRWPGYSDEPSPCGLPAWEARQIDDGTWSDGFAIQQKEAA
jgi:hypothetical protein